MARAKKQKGAKKKRKLRFGDIFFGLVFLAGLGLLLYPTAADLWNRYLSANVVRAYDAAVSALTQSVSDPETGETEIDRDLNAAHEYNENIATTSDGTIIINERLQEMLDAARAYNDDLDEMLSDAREYNEGLVENSPNEITPQPEEYEDLDLYMSLLNPLGSGVMGYISIDKIDVNLPIYHGTSDVELQVGVGHLVGSSLPVGGPSTHTVLAGHSGLPSASLFSDLEDLQKGDIFVLTVLGQRLGYEIDSMKVVLPEDVDDLKIRPGKDETTLITCTPYGINTHRLLVTGHRVDLPDEELEALVQGAGFPWVGAILVAAGALGVFVIFILCMRQFGKKKKRRAEAAAIEAAFADGDRGIKLDGALPDIDDDAGSG